MLKSFGTTFEKIVIRFFQKKPITMILILSIESEYSTSRVMEWLQLSGHEVVRLNADDNKHSFVSIDEKGIYVRNTITGRLINLKNASACWWRRRGISMKTFGHSGNKQLIQSGFDLTPIIEGRTGNIFRDESDALIEYIYDSIFKSCKINIGKPVFNLNRLIVLEIAARHGLAVPPYRVISDNFTLNATVNAFGPCVTKAIGNGLIHQTKTHRFHTYTESIDPNECLSLQQDTFFFPSLITQRIEKKFEIRSFYLDGHFYSMSICSQADEQTQVDFRKYNKKKPNRTEPFNMPLHIEDSLKNVFKELNLNCGSVDLIVDTEDQYIFLEINPVGQYAMVSEPCNYNLDRVIANYLIYGRHATH